MFVNAANGLHVTTVIPVKSYNVHFLNGVYKFLLNNLQLLTTNSHFLSNLKTFLSSNIVLARLKCLFSRVYI